MVQRVLICVVATDVLVKLDLPDQIANQVSVLRLFHLTQACHSLKLLSILDIDECLTTRPCQNGATCVNLRGGYRCTCKAGFTGPNCQSGECLASFPFDTSVSFT